MPQVVFQTGPLSENYSVYYVGPLRDFAISKISGDFPTQPYQVTGAQVVVSMVTEPYGNRTYRIKANNGAAFISDEFISQYLPNWHEKSFNLYPAYDYANITSIGWIATETGGSSTSLSLRAGAYITLTVTWEYTFTACREPSTVLKSGDPAKDNAEGALAETDTDVTVTGTGAAAGTENGITGYEFSARESADNGATWGAYSVIKTISTASTGFLTTLPPPGTRGNIWDYRVRTMGAAGVDYYSPYKAIGQIRKNRLPISPTSFAATPFLTEDGSISLAWSGEADVDGNIKHQKIQYAVKPAGGSYGAWADLKTATGSNTTTAQTLNRGAKIRFQTKSVDKLGAEADTWKASNEVERNSTPATPSILFPGAGKTIYNVQPYVGLSIGSEPNGQAQTLYYSVDGGAEVSAGAVAAGTKKMRMPTLTAGARTLRFWLKDSQGASSGQTAVTVTVAANTYARAIAQGTLLWDENAGHRASNELMDLKTRVNQVRSFYGLAAISLPYEGTTGGNTIKHFHTWMANAQALQQGLADTCAVSGATVPTWLTRTSNAPSAGIINQIRQAQSSL